METVLEIVVSISMFNRRQSASSTLKASILGLALLLNAIVALPTYADDRPVNLGLTPSPVYGLWTKINSAVVVYAREFASDDDWLEDLAAMKPDRFQNKVPANVLVLVQQFKAKLKDWNKSGKAIFGETLLEGKLPNLLSSKKSRVTPSLVYLHSGQVLVNIAGSILQISTSKAEIGPLFEPQNFSGKSPSDVYGLVDLALRRLEIIASRRKSDRSAVKKGAQ